MRASSGTFAAIVLPPDQAGHKFVHLPPSGNAVSLLVTSLADYDNSGRIDTADFFAFFTSFLNLEDDFNGDGVINTQDFFDFLTVFFMG